MAESSRSMTEADMEYTPLDEPPGHSHARDDGQAAHNAAAAVEEATSDPRLVDATNQSSPRSLLGDDEAHRPTEGSADEGKDGDGNKDEPTKSSLDLEIEKELNAVKNVMQTLGIDPQAPWSTKALAFRDEEGRKIPRKAEGFDLQCAWCERNEEQLGHDLTLFCSKCIHSHPFFRYCSKQCQIDDWPRHKRICGVLVSRENGLPIQLMPGRVSITHWAIAMNAVDKPHQVFLSAGSELMTYKMVIDAHRCIDEVKMDFYPGFRPRNMYFGWLRGYSFERLKKFLDRTLLDENMDVYMPLWWTKEHRDNCEDIARTFYQWDDVPSPIHPEINSFSRYGGVGLRMALRGAAARIDGDISAEAQERLDGLFAVEAMGYLNGDPFIH